MLSCRLGLEYRLHELLYPSAHLRLTMSRYTASSHLNTCPLQLRAAQLSDSGSHEALHAEKLRLVGVTLMGRRGYSHIQNTLIACSHARTLHRQLTFWCCLHCVDGFGSIGAETCSAISIAIAGVHHVGRGLARKAELATNLPILG